MFGTYRGRLIFPFIADIRPLDTEATAAAKGGEGFDPDFQEPSPIAPPAGQGPGTSTRTEGMPVALPCQVEMGTNEKMRQFFQGNSPSGRLVLVFHFRDLEGAGLVDAAGNATLRVGDRLEKITNQRTGAVEWTAKEPLYAVEIQPNAFGIGRGRNLLFVFFESRDKAANA